MAKIRVRIAPSPTGYVHVGNVYGALFNYAFARKNDGDFVLRLDDTDQKRHIEGAEEVLYAGLEWLGIEWDEGPDKGGPFGPYKPSEKKEKYNKIAKDLVVKDLAYVEDGAIKLKSPGKDFSWNDAIRGDITFPASEVKDFVILKSDGFPVYHFNSVVDDIEMQISHVIRGEEHISNTPRQLALFEALGAAPPMFAHFPTLRNADHKKLSKRRDPVDLRLYREAGYLPEALVNFLCLLGWSHPEGKEVFSLDEFVEKFSLERVRKAGPVFDTKKLDWLNGVYIRQLDNNKMAKLLNSYIAQETTIEFLESVVPLIKERINKLSEAESLLTFFWTRPVTERGTFESESAGNHIAEALIVLRRIPEWNLDEVNTSLSKAIKENGFKTGDFYMTLRLAISGVKITPPINESMIILGKDEVLFRLEEAQKTFVDIEPPEIG
ncbi:MAG: glutamate--tRNA ligase [Patescibacteria group bacterium]